jgi:nitrogen regulatory protein PII
MNKSSARNSYQLLVTIVNCGIANQIIRAAKKIGVKGATVLYGHGLSNGRFLSFLEMVDCRKEIILMIVNEMIIDDVLSTLTRDYKLNRPHHGVAFTINIDNFLGTGRYFYEDAQIKQGGESMFNSIYIIVDRGKAEEAMEYALKAGAQGGTIINARGSGIHETSKVFSMEIEPEKEILLIIAKTDNTKAIVELVSEKLEIEKPGNGIIFVQKVNKAVGIKDE